MDEIIWEAKVTQSMVANLTSNEISMLINELDDVVAEVCENYEVE